MDIAALQAFTQVAETGSFSNAAERLHITQPAISKRIATLEQQFNTKLFDRIGRKIQLTEAGRTLMPKARTILQELEESKRLINDLSGEIQGPLRLATSHHIGLHRLPPILRKFRRHHPGVSLDLHFMDSEDACRLIEKGDLEIGIVTLPTTKFSNLKTEKLWDDPLAFVCHPEHPLCTGQKIKLAALIEHDAILPGAGTFTRDLIDQLFQQAGHSPKIALETNYLETLKMMVSVGLGWSILPKTMLDKDLCEIKIMDCQPTRQLGIIQHKKRSLSNAAKAMLKILPTC
ncbi:MAG TPA: LysR family transcriptional regulator [Chromatiales bacterium]|nr:LysR family transcriptional regulator [Chromatiales bacterium]